MRMRKKKHGGERLSALAALLCTDSAILRENPRSVFAADAPLRLEIGCGKGDFVKQLSVAEPDYNYFAMEKVDDVLVVALEKYAASRELGGLGPHGGWLAPDGSLYAGGETWDIPMDMRGNVRFLSGDAKGLPEMFAEGAATGTPERRIISLVMALSGQRTATVGRPAVVHLGTQARAGSTMVSGPGQKRSARV